MKCPAELRGILGRGTDYLTARDGLALRKWVEGGGQLDPAIEAARNTLRTVTERGVNAVREAWDEYSDDIRKALGAGLLQELLESGQSFDDQRAHAASAEGAQLDDLNQSVLGGAPANKE
jgi:hypothetical protein